MARVVIDRRPIGVILLERSVRPLAFLALGLGFWAVLAATPPEGLSVEGLRALGVFGLCLVLWVTGLLPLAVTSLLAIGLLALAGVMEPAKAYSLFGNQAIFFVLGAFILAAAMMKTGLSARLALAFLRRVGSSPRRLVAGVMASTALMCFAMPSHAAAAMVFPIVIEIVNSLGLRPGRSRFSRSLLLALAWGSCVGSNLTLISSARAALALGFLAEAGLPGISFGEWSTVAIPMALAQWGAVLGLLLLFFPPDIESVEPAIEALARRTRSMGKVTTDERLAGLVLASAMAAWAFGGLEWGLAGIAVIAAVSLFVLRVLTWKDAEEYVNWGIFLLYGGAIALGAALDRSGAAHWLTTRTLGSWVESPWAFVTAISGLSVALTEGVSNSAVVAGLGPLAIALARDIGIDPRVLVMAVVMPAGLAFALPTSTPALALAFSSGHLRVRDTLLPGLAMDAACWVLFLLTMWAWMPVVGYAVGP
jgi:sodium-dependent dicarboxylate transporter 2/3/5